MRLACTIAGALLFAGASAEAQGARMATLPSPAPVAAQVPVIVLRDGSVVADFGRGYERVIRACSASGGTWPGGQPRGHISDRAPQGGSASPPPGANGLPPAPGMSASPGAQRASVGTASVGTTTVGRSTVGLSGTTASAVGTSNGSLQSTHSGWRTAGPAYYDGACYTYDAYGRLRLVQR
ncbi:MAG: hypothetical protein H0X64_02745 [Gemmatimonadaceae bacterium]|nr:hypothetical protein [Gemmatimonadaceae bacterium]